LRADRFQFARSQIVPDDAYYGNTLFIGFSNAIRLENDGIFLARHQVLDDSKQTGKIFEAQSAVCRSSFIVHLSLRNGAAPTMTNEQ
jgi:hypothetical protein